MFVDHAVIRVISGKGGNGVVHFRREKFVPYGGPDGGDGGKGGDVIISVNPKLNTLTAFRQQKRYKAADGMNGAKQNMTGKSGDDLIIEVLPGTIIFDETNNEVLGDLVNPTDFLAIVKGGRGGRGNSHFATSRNQAPRIAEKGEPSHEKEIRLELKLIADAGIVGVPNAGKSTLLSVATRAKPKIAPYPFTTIEPNLGVVELDEDNSMVFADIPGLIQGAHAGVGLGDEFLRHIQRTRVIIHLLDGTSNDPLDDFKHINEELALFDTQLSEKPQVVAINKIDIPGVLEKMPEVKERLKREYSVRVVFEISAITKENVRELLYRVFQILQELPVETRQIEMPVYRYEENPRDFKIVRQSEGWRVTGESIEQVVAMTYWEHHQAVRRFQHIFKSLGIEDAIRAAGIQPGDSVYIGDYELEWSD
jgi:GTP-binding protein